MDKEILSALGALLDEKLNPIKEDISGVKKDVSGLKGDVSSLKEDVKYIKIQQEEQGKILRVLEDKAITNKAEHDKLSNDIIQLSGKVENMRKDLATVEVVTARNMENIAQLKVIK
ncbi:hypothetical protein [Clostridium sporogenes]|uniref:hypothetical protein n=1 Tax=Clostridium sporogenes TaxID=1509 RepID=UPI0013CABC11|nr:hypothetical protein [Clostridium sporogenes]NFF64896.1 hypothetical protein [Clostridium sporogenes]